MQKMEHKLVQKLDLLQANQQTVLETVDAHTAQLAANTSKIASMNARIEHLEQSQSQHGEAPNHVAKLQADFQDLAQQVHAITHHRAPSAPPTAARTPSFGNPNQPRAASTSPVRQRSTSQSLPTSSTNSIPEVDWNRLIVGGWHADTRRETVETEAKTLIQTMGIQDAVLETIVYGRRATTCHVVLQSLPDTEAKKRMLTWQSLHKDKYTVPSSNKSAWLTPHKSAQKRFKNRATKYATDVLHSLVAPDSSTQVDVDWNKQILWLDDLRVASFQRLDLSHDKTDEIQDHVYHDPRSKEELTIHFNLTRLSTATAKEVVELKQALTHWKTE